MTTTTMVLAVGLLGVIWTLIGQHQRDTPDTLVALCSIGSVMCQVILVAIALWWLLSGFPGACQWKELPYGACW